ncbi:MAG: EpsG family protein [Clostridiaceae bacterium]|nr:EpsG family protein [Clostridiaceae bacterium]
MESFVYIYFPMIILSLVFAYLALHGRPKSLQKIFWLLSVLMPIFVAAFRYDNGADYLMYDRMYRSILQTGDHASIKTIEIGFKWLTQFCQIFSSKSILLFVVCAVLIVLFYYKGTVDILNDSRSIMFGLLLFYATGTYFDSFNGIRQYIAAAIIYWAFQFIIKEELKKWLIAVSCAALFHYTAIIMLPVYFIRKFNFRIKRSLIIIATSWFGGAIAYNLVAWILQYTRYRYFLTSVEFVVMPTEASTLYTSIVTVITFIIVLSGKKQKKYMPTLKDEFLLNMQVLTICSALLSWTVPLMWRVQYYFLPMEMVIVPSVLNLEKRKYVRTLMKYTILSMYTVIVLYGILKNGWFDCVPWKFYFDYM